jgi:hypothetical protein
MLQGTSSDGWRFGALTSMGMLLFLLAAWRLRRVLASRP